MWTASGWAQRLTALLLERCAKRLDFYSSHKTDACGRLVFVFFPFKVLCWLEFSKRWRNTPPLWHPMGRFLSDSAGLAGQAWHPGLVKLGYTQSVGFYHSTPLHLVPMVCKNEVRLYCDIVISHPLSHSMFTGTPTPTHPQAIPIPSWASWG